MAKYWWGKILANLANCSCVAKIKPAKILPLNTEFIVPVIIISCKHGKYFCHESKQKLPVLPDSKGKVPSSSIESMNNIFHDILNEKTTPHGKRGEYLSITPAQKFSIGKCAAENGVTATIRYYTKTFPDLLLSNLKETTMQRLKNNYQASLKTNQGSSKELPGKKR